MFNISCVISLLFMIVPVCESTVRAYFSKSVIFTRITVCTEQELSFRNFSQICNAKRINTNFVNVMFCYYISSKEVLQSLPKKLSNQKANRCCNSSDTETCTCSETYRGEKILQVIAANYKSKLQINNTCIRMCFP